MIDQVTQASGSKQKRRTNSGLNAYNGPWGPEQALHLSRRTIYGTKKADLVMLTALGPQGAVNQLLEWPISAPAPPVNNYNNANYTDPTVPAGETWVNAAKLIGGEFRRRASWAYWYVGVMINQPLSIVEKMTAFLSTYLVTEADVVGDGRFIYKTNALIRSHALGNFKELVKKISIDPGMLIYLNGYLNSSGKPDENYSRELQELFTQGKGEDSKYTEDDVKAAARLLTGYTFDSVNISYKFNPNKHDTGDKQFSSYYNNTLITGKTGAAGEQELDELIDMLFNTEEAAKFFVRRLYNYFVYYDISQAEEDNIITPLADLFRSSNYEIKPVLEALLNSEHFYDTLNVGCVIKSGYDLVIGALRQFEVGFSPSSNYVAQYSQWSQMRIQLIILQHDPGAPPNVAGYPAYYQAPQFHEIWINSVTLPARQSWTARMLSNGYTVSGFKVIIDPIAYAMTLDNPGDPNTLVAESVFLLFGLPVSTDALDFMKAILLSGQTSDYYWTSAWEDYLADPTSNAKKTIVLSRLNALYTFMTNEEEFQLS